MIFSRPRAKSRLGKGFADLTQTILDSPYGYVLGKSESWEVELHHRLVLNGRNPYVPESKQGCRDAWKGRTLGGRGQVVDALTRIVSDGEGYLAYLYLDGVYAFTGEESSPVFAGDAFTATEALRMLESVIDTVTLPVHGRSIERRSDMQEWDTMFRSFA